MIYSLNTTCIPIVAKVKEGENSVTYSWGNIDALNKWIEAMNKKGVEASLGIDGGVKYPLVWLAEGWSGELFPPGIKFSDVVFYISRNAKENTLNENRTENFEKLYLIGNSLIKTLKKFSRIDEADISYFEKPCFSTPSKTGEGGKPLTSDIWDTLIIKIKEMHVVNINNCFT